MFHMQRGLQSYIFSNFALIFQYLYDQHLRAIHLRAQFDFFSSVFISISLQLALASYSLKSTF